MRYTIEYTPFFHIVIRNTFSKKVNRDILREAVKNKKHYKDATIGSNIKGFRTNKVLYMDELYVKDRSKSILIKSFEKLFQKDDRFRETLASSPYPICEFLLTNTHETQVSRYGDKEQKYDFHIDRFADTSRLISIIYYFNLEPQCWEGGLLEITNSPIHNGKEVDEYVSNRCISPENNMCIIFGGNNAHRVLPTNSPKDFSQGRFSMNCWVGIK